MAKTDPELGKKIKEHLTILGLETQTAEANYHAAAVELRDGVYGFLANMGLDVVEDDSISNTPERVAEMFVGELCHGLNYDNFPKCTTTTNGRKTVNHKKYVAAVEYEGDSIHQTLYDVHKDMRGWDYKFDSIAGATSEMVLVRKIQTVSLCEHHFQTISGVTHIAYIPGPKLLGLSKFARVTNFFARRPQVQERMTEQIFAALSFILDTQDIAVQQEAVHNCMRARGAMDPASDTVTCRLGGKFMDNPALRGEFLNAIR